MATIKIYSTDDSPAAIFNMTDVQCEELREELETTTNRVMRIDMNHGKSVSLFTAHVTKIEVSL